MSGLSGEVPDGRPVAHGYLTLALATPFVTPLLAIDEPALNVMA